MRVCDRRSNDALNELALISHVGDAQNRLDGRSGIMMGKNIQGNMVERNQGLWTTPLALGVSEVTPPLSAA